MRDIHFGWNAGEFGPEFWGRSDIERYSLGAARIENLQVSYSGALITGPRSRYAERLQYPAAAVRLFSFEFSASIDNAYVLIFNGGKIRFARAGSYILEDDVAFADVTNGVVTSTAHGYSNGDFVYLDGYAFPVVVAGVSTDEWTANTIEGSLVDITLAAGNSNRVFTLAHPFSDADLGEVVSYQVFDQVKFTHKDYTRQVLTRTSTTWTIADETLTGGKPLDFSVTGTDTGKFIRSVRVTATGSGYTDATVLTVTDGVSGSGAVVKPVVESGALVGVTIIEGGRNYTAPSISADVGTGATFEVTLSETKAEYTVAVSAIIDGNETGISRPTVLTGRANFTVAAGSAEYTWSAVTGAESYNVYRSRVFPEVGQASAGSELFFIGNVRGTAFTDSNVQADTTKGPRFFYDPFAAGAITHVNVTAPGSGYTHTSTVSASGGGSGFLAYPIVRSGALIGIYIADPGKGYVNPVITIGTGTGATTTVEQSAATGLEPAISYIFQQRAGYAASSAAPTTLRGSRDKEFDNFSIPLVLAASDPYEYTVDSTRLSPIRYVLPVQQGLLVFTRDGVSLLRATEGRAVTPLDGILDPQSYIGSAQIPPMLFGETILHVEEKSRGIRMLVFNAVARKFEGEEISFFSREMFRRKTIVATAAAYGFENKIYIVFSDGTGSIATIQREQQTFAFTRWSTQGKLKAVTAVNVGTEEHIYVAALRGSQLLLEYIKPNDSDAPEDRIVIDGAISTEKVHPAATVTLSGTTGVITVTASSAVFGSGDIDKAFAADGGLGIVTDYTSTTVIEVTLLRDTSGTAYLNECAAGEWWLNERVESVTGIPYTGEVFVMGDGKVLSAETVVDGEISLSEPAAIVHVGYAVDSRFKTLSPGNIEGLNRNILGIALYYKSASAFQIAMNGTTDDVSLRTDEAFAAAVDLRREGEEFIFVASNWDRDGKLEVIVPPGASAEILRAVLFYEAEDARDE